MSKMKQMLLATAMMCAAAQSYDKHPYSLKSKKGMRFNPDYKGQASVKELREFTVKGKKIMAYSKKDAIKRFKHNE